MNYRWETCKKLEILRGKEYKLGDLVKEVEKIVELDKQIEIINEIFKPREGFIIDWLPFSPVVYIKDEGNYCEWNEAQGYYQNKIEYWFGEDDNNIFIEYLIIEDNKNQEKQKVKVIDIWS